MLSEESAIGKYPVLAVETMVKIALEAETAFSHEERLQERRQGVLPEVNDATARAACEIAYQIGARAIVAFTAGGTTALRVSKYRPSQPILAVTPSEMVMRCLSLVWGVYPVQRQDPPSLEVLFDIAREVAIEMGEVRQGDLIVLTAGVPLMVPGSTNLVKVQVV
jgi:pyruvate kinase